MTNISKMFLVGDLQGVNTDYYIGHTTGENFGIWLKGFETIEIVSEYFKAGTVEYLGNILITFPSNPF